MNTSIRKSKRDSVGMSSLPGFTPITFRKKVSEYDDVYSFIFDRAGIKYEAGQYTHMLVGALGRGGVGEFSFASAPSEGNLRFTMHIGSQSIFKQRMMALEPGDRVQLFKIKGHFTLPIGNNKPITFIAGGVGMAPIRSLLIEAGGQDRPFYRSLVQAQRGNHLFSDEVKSSLDQYLKITPEQLEQTIVKVTQDQTTADYYICGSERFISGVIGFLNQAGINETRIHTENFKQYPIEDNLEAATI